MTSRGLLTPPQLISAFPCFVCHRALWLWWLSWKPVFVCKRQPKKAEEKGVTITGICENEMCFAVRHPRPCFQKHLERNAITEVMGRGFCWLLHLLFLSSAE